jgi:hypothetical protein
MPIILQSTVGGFSPGFIAELPALEAAMRANGLEPDDFILAKDRATPAAAMVPTIAPFFWDYTVFIGDEHFTVTEPNDVRFLEFLHGRIAAPEPDATARRWSWPGVFGRIARWMSQPI